MPTDPLEQRQTEESLYDTKGYGPGKFHNKLGEIVYKYLGNGSEDGSVGDSETFGYYALFADLRIKGLRRHIHAITEEDSSGFLMVYQVQDRETGQSCMAEHRGELPRFRGGGTNLMSPESTDQAHLGARGVHRSHRLRTADRHASRASGPARALARRDRTDHPEGETKMKPNQAATPWANMTSVQRATMLRAFLSMSILWTLFGLGVLFVVAGLFVVVIGAILAAFTIGGFATASIGWGLVLVGAIVGVIGFFL